MGGICARAKQGPCLQYNKNMYVFDYVVGKGGFGRVWKVNDKRTRRVYALKVIDKARVITKKSIHSVLNERQILSDLLEEENDFIVNLKCAFQDRQNLYLLLDYVEAGDLRHYINRGITFTEIQIKFLVRCLLEGLSHLHKHNIIHRDIKPENIIIDQWGYARITDLGIARYSKPENSQQTSGTLGYMAPEVLMRQNHSFCVDFYAVGIIAYELLVKNRPFFGNRQAIKNEILTKVAKVPAGFQERMSPQGINFINSLLQRTANRRLGSNGIFQVVNHPWLILSEKDHSEFVSKRMDSPILPSSTGINKGLQQATEPDDVWRENILLLKKADVQKLFESYDFNPYLDKVRTSQRRNSEQLKSLSTAVNHLI